MEEHGGGAEERLRSYEESMRRLRNLRIPDLTSMWIEYDKASDTLYINFGKGEAEETVMVDDDTIAFISGDTLIGIAVQNASKRLGIEPPY